MPATEQFPFMATSYRDGPAQWIDNRDRYVEQYTGSAYIAIGAIAKMAAMQKAKVLRRIEKKSGTRFEEVSYTHPLVQLFDEVNPVDTPWDLWFYTIAWSLLAGNSYIYKARNGFGTPVQLWPMPPQWVKAIPDPVQYISGYEINSKFGHGFYVPKNMIVEFKQPSLDWSSNGRYYGQPAIKAASTTLDLENEMLRRLHYQFKNFAPPSMVFETDQRLQPNQVQQIWAQMAAQHGMSASTGRPLVVHSGMKLAGSWNASSAKEMAYTESLDKTLEITMATLGVPPAIVGLTKGQNRCLDDQTECLTDTGWKKYSDITYETKIACYDPDAEVIRYRKPSGIFIYDHDGPMHLWKSRVSEMMVTPNHRLYCRRSKQSGNFAFELSESAANKHDTTVLVAPPCGAACSAPEGLSVVIDPSADKVRSVDVPDDVQGWHPIKSMANLIGQKPATVRSWAEKGWIKHRVSNARRGIQWEVNADEIRNLQIGPRGGLRGAVHIDADDWMEFLGWYVSEGYAYIRNGKGHVGLCQSSVANPEKTAQIDRLMNRLPLRHSRYVDQKDGMVKWIIYDKGLAQHLMQHCGVHAANKRVPAYVKDYPRSSLQILLDAAISGDGSRSKRGVHQFYVTTSQQLADDIQEICIKCGHHASMSVRKIPHDRHRTQYHVGITPHKTTTTFVAKQALSTVQYSGKVWCLEVPTGLFVVRRNGKVVITGNSNMEASIASFARTTVNPLLEQLSQHLTQDLARDFAPDKSLFVKIGPCEIDQSETVRKGIETMIRAGAVTPNEVRHLLLELGPLDSKHGDNPVMISGFQQTDPDAQGGQGSSESDPEEDQVVQVSRQGQSGQNQSDTAES